jgi:uncharacterized membrane protein
MNHSHAMTPLQYAPIAVVRNAVAAIVRENEALLEIEFGVNYIVSVRVGLVAAMTVGVCAGVGIAAILRRFVVDDFGKAIVCIHVFFCHCIQALSV